jgi:hypothetical protein
MLVEAVQHQINPEVEAVVEQVQLVVVEQILLQEHQHHQVELVEKVEPVAQV